MDEQATPEQHTQLSRQPQSSEAEPSQFLQVCQTLRQVPQCIFLSKVVSA